MQPAEILAHQRTSFDETPMPDAQARIALLKTLERLLGEHQDRILDAISADFGNRSRIESLMSEILPTLAASAMRGAMSPAGCGRSAAP